MATPPPTVMELAAITLTSKIPDFWTDQPRVWFFRVEAMLAPQKLSDDARFDIVVSKLSKEAIQQVTDILSDPPAAKKFEALKTRLLTTYEESKNRQLQKLIGEMELGDQKPSQLLRRMRELAKDKIPDETLRMMWQGHLPTNIRAVIAVSDTKELDSLANLADTVLESTRTAHVNEIAQQQQQPSSSVSKDTELIIAEIAKLSVRVADIERSRGNYQNNRWNNRSRSASRNRSQSPAERRTRRTPESPDWVCFYHYRFRENAKNCKEPCSWKSRQGN